jgi:membrane peptidoglycan carboxypeptidase
LARKVVRSQPFHRVVTRFAKFIGVAAVTGLVASGMTIPFIHLTGVAAKSGADLIDDLPLDLDMGELSQTTRILDAHGKVITTLYDQNRSYKALDQISPNMPKALLAIEDSRFYEHGAMDLKGTLRALLRNSASESGAVQGGSSITQQLVKTTLVYGADTDAERAAATEKSTARKVRELRYSIWLEENHDKDWILERYLNAAYFGDSAYGVQAAAKHYFNVDAADLTWGQASMLAGMVKNPTGYDPTDYPDAAIARRNLVLERLAQVGDLPRADAEKLKGTELGLNVQRSRNGCFGSSAEFFCDYALQWLLADESLGETEAERWRLLQTGGLTIRTTLDSSFQKAAQKSVSRRVAPTDNAVGALAMVEPGTGKVRLATVHMEDEFVTSSQDVVIEFEVPPSKKLVGTYFVSVHLNNDQGTVIVQCDSRLVGRWFDPGQHHKGRLVIRGLWLKPGRYTVDVYACQAGVLDAWEGAWQFEVLPDLPYPEFAESSSTEKGTIFADFDYQGA